MQRLLFSVFCLSLFAGFPQALSAGEDVEEAKAKQEVAKREESYVKVEVRGTLRHDVRTRLESPSETWWITAGPLTWELDFGQNNEFLEMAKATHEEAVVVTGALETRPMPGFFGPGTTVLRVVTLKTTAK